MNPVIFDIDGTICDSSQFSFLQSAQTVCYKEFWDAIPTFKTLPLIKVVKYYLIMEMYDAPVVFATARNEGARNDTLEWLKTHLGRDIDSSRLYMRGIDDYRPDAVLKSVMLDEILDRFDTVVDEVCVYEDKPEVQQMFIDRRVGELFCPVKNEWLIKKS